MSGPFDTDDRRNVRQWGSGKPVDVSVQLWAVGECQQVGRVTIERAQLCVASWDVAFPAGHRILLRPERTNPLPKSPSTGSSFPWAKRSECVADH